MWVVLLTACIFSFQQTSQTMLVTGRTTWRVHRRKTAPACRSWSKENPLPPALCWAQRVVRKVEARPPGGRCRGEQGRGWVGTLLRAHLHLLLGSWASAAASACCPPSQSLANLTHLGCMGPAVTTWQGQGCSDACHLFIVRCRKAGAPWVGSCCTNPSCSDGWRLMRRAGAAGFVHGEMLGAPTTLVGGLCRCIVPQCNNDSASSQKTNCGHVPPLHTPAAPSTHQLPPIKPPPLLPVCPALVLQHAHAPVERPTCREQTSNIRLGRHLQCRRCPL